ncbi:TPA: YjbQ family protein [Candidatus Geothermarchaeota archaeon]|nr:YjbQ family protein [Candidatus Geothermarchaeota archaeon]HIQ13722.1 YjbQ family protein [Thermoprotei archaeon]
MKVYREEFILETRGEGDIIDISGRVREAIARSGVRDGLAHIYCPGSTAAISSIEYEPGLKEDVFNILDLIVPRDRVYKHNIRWGDDNGHSHVRSFLIKPFYIVPVVDGSPLLGTWQQIVYIELDVRPRMRRIIISVLGE